MGSSSMEESIAFAKKYLEDLLSFFDFNTDIHASYEDDVIELSVPSSHLNGFLIGQRGETLRSLQFLVSMSLRNNDYEYSRVNLDIAEYKKQRSDRLIAEVAVWVEKVRGSGEDMSLRPMSPVDRRTVHKAAGEFTGVGTESAGVDHDRHVVIKLQTNIEATK